MTTGCSLRLLATALLAAPFLGLGGCARQQVATEKMDLLIAAGFETRPASTPERQVMLGHLPPNHFATRTVDDKLIYLYADPLACNCVYFGTAADFSRYEQERAQQSLPTEPQMEAQLDTVPGWAWGPWAISIR
jgi:hypothetical protein